MRIPTIVLWIYLLVIREISQKDVLMEIYRNMYVPGSEIQECDLFSNLSFTMVLAQESRQLSIVIILYYYHQIVSRRTCSIIFINPIIQTSIAK